MFSFIPATSKEVKNKSLSWECFQAQSSGSSLNPWSYSCEDTVSLTQSTELQHRGQLCSDHHSSGREHSELRHSTCSRSSLQKMNTAPLVSATQLRRNREFSESTVFAAHWVTGWGKGRMQPELHLDYSKQHGCSTEYLYCHKSYGTLFYLPKNHGTSPDKKSITHSWDFTAKPTRMSENYTNT